jgi:SAM-dependent methyltransferase
MALRDEYALSAEYIDIMSAEPWKSFGPALSCALHGLEPDGAPIIDVGAGSGLGTQVIAQSLAEVEIVAVEPSVSLRSVLLARSNGDERLRSRVTVLTDDFLGARLPDRWGGMVAMNVIGHFDRSQRIRMWSLLAERLAPAGRAILNLLPPTTAVAVPEARGSTVRVGRRRYEGWARAEPAGENQLTWHMTYRTYHDDSTNAA